MKLRKYRFCSDMSLIKNKHRYKVLMVAFALLYCASLSGESLSPSSGSELILEEQQWTCLQTGRVTLHVLWVVLQTGDELFHCFALKADLVDSCKQRKPAGENRYSVCIQINTHKLYIQYWSVLIRSICQMQWHRSRWINQNIFMVKTNYGRRTHFCVIE